ncbi:hypothetical protein SNE26_06790 [Mucilaginibacter sp. cycad4]|uniref:hypothetical protein n=1 Tax=Mucilaginibacter sp. cycad4 TaxID=3342096 RepID=UPI002AAB5033|nr:hypothetical protein [Mucilaginibacter gossypii]WPV01476.1 hypothetical protein SNE26_06790 [Mucilaginibacter gossypii]
MTRKISFILLMVSLGACTKKANKPACSISECTQEFRSVGIRFTDKAGAGVDVQNFSVKNLRSDSIIAGQGVIDPGFSPAYRTIATDGNKAQLSAEGDNLEISATHPVTHQVKTAIVKIAGGCACHISKISGPDTVAFD